jgi:histidine triad (HIT) family protein
MYSHAPENYDCPFCKIVAGEAVGGDWTAPDDVVLRTDHITAFIGAAWWPNNAGHVIVIPNQHIENIYVMPPETHMHVVEAARQIAIALRTTYDHCTGTSTRQHNEPDGYQEVWHHHLHVFPRYRNDFLYDLTARRRFTRAEERHLYAERLRQYLDTHLEP